MLSDLSTLKTFIGIPDTTQDDKLSLCLIAADGAIKRYCKRLFETQVIVEYPLFRGGGEALVLEQTPILSYRLTGNITSGQPTITGLSSTNNLIAGMPALQAINANGPNAQPFPNGATVLSVDSDSQVTMTDNATATLSGVPFLFGLALWWDLQGHYGDGCGSDPAGPFGPGTLLLAGRHYSIQRDQPDGSSKSGKLTRLGWILPGAWGTYGSYWGGLQSRGTLSTPLPPLWPRYPPGSVKVIYASGLGFGAALNGALPSDTTIPPELTASVNAVAAWLWNNAHKGLIQVQSEGFQGYNASLAQAVDALKAEDVLGSTRQILSRYRKLSL